MKARRSLRNGFITLVLALALAVGLLLAVPGLKDVATTVSNMKAQWLVVAVVLEDGHCDQRCGGACCDRRYLVAD